MRHAPSSSHRPALWIVVMIWAGTSGCIHNHYYGTMPTFPPGSMPTTTQIGGPICDVPSSSNGVVVSSSSPASGTISSNVVIPAPASNASAVAAANTQPRILISQPAYRPSSPGTGFTLSRWRRLDPESVANVRTEGALDDGTVNR